ncbi:MAG: DUF6249 domain-containing protein [Anaerolineae bacterium]
MTVSLWTLLLAPVLLVLVVLAFVTLNRYIAYKERVALAQLGFSPEDLSRHMAARSQGNRGVLWGGVVTAASGLALTLGLATLGVGAWLLGGLVPLFVGLGIVLIYYMTMGPAPINGQAVATHLDEGESDARAVSDAVSKYTPFGSEGTPTCTDEPDRQD